MKDQTANRLADAWFEVLETFQISVKDVFQLFAGVPLPTKFRGLVRVAQRADLVRTFKKMPEPDKNKLAQQLAMIQAFKSAPHKMRALMKQRIRELPHPPGGAPKKIKTEEEATVCAEIEGLRPQIDTRAAIGRVAARRGVSERTIYRIWGKYRPKKKRPSAKKSMD